ncbi:MAG: hypothetical protein IJ903_05610 [Ruminococcus sp.]|nr:hypothetical protein [Ruminococcus sp.]
MDNPETVYYKDDWKPVYNPETFERVNSGDNEENEEAVPEKKKKASGKPMVLIIQIIICAVAFLSLYAIKSFDIGVFNDVYKWYEDNLNNEIIISETFMDFSLDKIINAVENK